MPALVLPFQSAISSVSTETKTKLRTSSSHSLLPPRGISIFSSVFPFRLKYLHLSARPPKKCSGTGRPLVLSKRGELEFRPMSSLGGSLDRGKNLVEHNEGELGGNGKRGGFRSSNRRKRGGGNGEFPVSKRSFGGEFVVKEMGFSALEERDFSSNYGRVRGREAIKVDDESEDGEVRGEDGFAKDGSKGLVSSPQLGREDSVPQSRSETSSGDSDSYLSQTRYLFSLSSFIKLCMT